MEKSENETSKNVIHVRDFSVSLLMYLNSLAQVESVLDRQTEKINMFRLIINPESFGQSVENLFYLSFLIRDGKAALEFDEKTAEPVVCELL